MHTVCLDRQNLQCQKSKKIFFFLRIVFVTGRVVGCFGLFVNHRARQGKGTRSRGQERPGHTWVSMPNLVVLGRTMAIHFVVLLAMKGHYHFCKGVKL